jgi:hypothetical protein
MVINLKMQAYYPGKNLSGVVSGLIGGSSGVIGQYPNPIHVIISI